MSISASSVTLAAALSPPVKPNTGPAATGVFGVRMRSGGGVSQPLGSGARARVTDPIWGGVRRWLARRPWPAPSPAVRGRARFPTPWFKGLAFQFPPAGFGTMRSGTRGWRGFVVFHHSVGPAGAGFGIPPYEVGVPLGWQVVEVDGLDGLVDVVLVGKVGGKHGSPPGCDSARRRPPGPSGVEGPGVSGSWSCWDR